MKITEQNSYRPITIVLETEEEAKELLNILDRIGCSESCHDSSYVEVLNLRKALRHRLGPTVADPYIGELRRTR